LRYSKLFVENRRIETYPLLFGALVGVTPSEFRRDLWLQKISPRAIVWRCLRDPAYVDVSS